MWPRPPGPALSCPPTGRPLTRPFWVVAAHSRYVLQLHVMKRALCESHQCAVQPEELLDPVRAAISPDHLPLINCP